MKTIHSKLPLNYAAQGTQATGLILQAPTLAQRPRILRSAGLNGASLCGGQLGPCHQVLRTMTGQWLAQSRQCQCKTVKPYFSNAAVAAGPRRNSTNEAALALAVRVSATG
jgi:hypothetical protein